MIGAINGYEQNYNYFQAKPVTEREARPVYGGDNNFFVNPPAGAYYPPQDLFSGKTAGISTLVDSAAIGAGGARDVQQNLVAQAGYAAGTSSRSWVC